MTNYPQYPQYPQYVHVTDYVTDSNPNAHGDINFVYTDSGLIGVHETKTEKCLT